MNNVQKQRYITAVQCLQSRPALATATIPNAVSRFDDFQGVHIQRTFQIHFVVRGASCVFYSFCGLTARRVISWRGIGTTSPCTSRRSAASADTPARNRKHRLPAPPQLRYITRVTGIGTGHLTRQTCSPHRCGIPPRGSVGTAHRSRPTPAHSRCRAPRAAAV